jgi:hypothetical protein
MARTSALRPKYAPRVRAAVEAIVAETVVVPADVVAEVVAVPAVLVRAAAVETAAADKV